MDCPELYAREHNGLLDKCVRSRLRPCLPHEGQTSVMVRCTIMSEEWCRIGKGYD
jgi:hypothetical protein